MSDQQVIFSMIRVGRVPTEPGGAAQHLPGVLLSPLPTLAVEALGHIGDRRPLTLLMEIVRGTRPPATSRTVTGCGDAWSEETITQAAAVRALGLIGDDSVLPTLTGALESTVTRAEAAEALARFGSKAIPWLLPVLTTSQDDNLRYHVKETLALVGWRGKITK